MNRKEWCEKLDEAVLGIFREFNGCPLSPSFVAAEIGGIGTWPTPVLTTQAVTASFKRLGLHEYQGMRVDGDPLGKLYVLVPANAGR